MSVSLNVSAVMPLDSWFWVASTSVLALILLVYGMYNESIDSRKTQLIAPRVCRYCLVVPRDDVSKI